MRKILCSPSLAFDSAHVKYGVCTGHLAKFSFQKNTLATSFCSICFVLTAADYCCCYCKLCKLHKSLKEMLELATRIFLPFLKFIICSIELICDLIYNHANIRTDWKSFYPATLVWPSVNGRPCDSSYFLVSSITTWTVTSDYKRFGRANQTESFESCNKALKFTSPRTKIAERNTGNLILTSFGIAWGGTRD